MMLVKIVLTSTSLATGFEGGPVFPLLSYSCLYNNVNSFNENTAEDVGNSSLYTVAPFTTYA